MIQEALTNVARHARASRCEVLLHRCADRFEVVVRDDGEGFSVSRLNGSASSGGVGLIGMRERALQLAGMVALESSPGAGTVVRILLPSRVPPVPDPVSPPLTIAHRLEPF